MGLDTKTNVIDLYSAFGGIDNIKTELFSNDKLHINKDGASYYSRMIFEHLNALDPKLYY